MKNFRTIMIILFSASILFMHSCYSLVGSSLSPEIKSISIVNFQNTAPLFNPNLSQQFTLDLTDRFDQRTNLSIVKERGDITVQGEIIDYRISPSNVGVGSNGNEVANQNTLYIKVRVRYDNTKEPAKSWDRTFFDSEPFDANQTLQTVEVGLIEVINERLINQIFNAIVTDW